MTGLQPQAGPFRRSVMQNTATVGKLDCADEMPFDDTLVGGPYFLSPHTYCCEFEDGAVILDLRSGRYLGVDAEHLPELRRRVGNWPDSREMHRDRDCVRPSSSDDLISDLLKRGILTRFTVPRRLNLIEKPHLPMAITVERAIQRRIPIRHMIRFLLAFLIVLGRLRLGLPSLLGWLHRRQHTLARRAQISTAERPENLLASFFRLRIWCYTAQHRCLFDSLVLAAFLTRTGVPCSFVIGVATKPFLAHSWVQIGQFVLNDTAEHVLQFQPILAIGNCE